MKLDIKKSRYRFSEVVKAVGDLPKGWALERSRPEREDDRYSLWSNHPDNIGTTYHYGRLSEVVQAASDIEKHGKPYC